MAFNPQQKTADELVDLLATQPRRYLDACITTSQPAQRHHSITRQSPLRSASSLERLPLEILHIVLHYVDLLSITRVASTSLRLRQCVESLPAFQDLLGRAPLVLAVMGRTNTARLHAVSRVHAELETSQCISCGDFGPYLFLLTCERCCLTCLSGNESLWLTTKPLAKKVFSLSTTQMRQIPEIHSLPGNYFVANAIQEKHRRRLVSVKAAKRLALQVHGSSFQALKDAIPSPRSCPDDATAQQMKNWALAHLFLDAPLQRLLKNPSLVPSQGRSPGDQYNGLGATLAPMLASRDRTEFGVWCRGCHRTALDLDRGRLSQAFVDGMAPSGVHAWRAFRGWRDRAWLRDDFIQHIQHCHGASLILSEAGWD